MNFSLMAAVFLGAGVGGVLRWQVGIHVARWLGAAFPWGTLIVNISGSTVIGIVSAFFLSRADAGLWQAGRLFLITGVIGGYTTFSTFSLETIEMLEGGKYVAAAGYCLGSVILSFAGGWIGLSVVRSLS